MGKPTMKTILAISAVLVLGAGQGFTSPYVPAGQSIPGASIPTAAEKIPPVVKVGRDAPAKEEKSDCDDCVIVKSGLALPVPALQPGEGSGPSAPNTLLAGTLWGLFMVSRKKGMRRTYIRGVTVP